jgi:hypothetical protein
MRVEVSRSALKSPDEPAPNKKPLRAKRRSNSMRLLPLYLVHKKKGRKQKTRRYDIIKLIDLIKTNVRYYFVRK